MLFFKKIKAKKVTITIIFLSKIEKFKGALLILYKNIIML